MARNSPPMTDLQFIKNIQSVYIIRYKSKKVNRTLYKNIQNIHCNKL